jgi:hypothetical protein
LSTKHQQKHKAEQNQYLVGCKEIAQDVLWCGQEGNVQPNDPTWNLMGMGNNQVFRVKVPNTSFDLNIRLSPGSRRVDG